MGVRLGSVLTLWCRAGAEEGRWEGGGCWWVGGEVEGVGRVVGPAFAPIPSSIN